MRTLRMYSALLCLCLVVPLSYGQKVSTNSLPHSSADSLLMQAQEFRKEYRFAEAIKLLEKVLAADYLNVTVLADYADLCQKTGRTSQARQTFQKLAALDSLRVYPLVSLALLEMAETNYQPAIDLLRQAARIDSSNQMVIRYMARCYESADSASKAFDLYRQLVLLNPDDARVAFRAINMAIKSTRISDGLALAKSFRERDTTDADINQQFAYLLLLDKQYQPSIEMFEQCRQQGDTSFFVNKYQGLAWYRLKEYEPAKECLDKAYAENNKDFETCFFLGKTCVNSYYKKLGIAYFEKSLAIVMPDSVLISDLLVEMADGYFTLSQNEEGYETMLKAYTYNPESPLILYNLAQCYDRQKKDERKALKYYSEYLQLVEADSLCRTEGSDSYYRKRFIESRIKAIEEAQFWKGEKSPKN